MSRATAADLFALLAAVATVLGAILFGPGFAG